MQLEPARARRFSRSQATLAAPTLSRIPFPVPFLEYSLLAIGSERPLSPKRLVELLLNDWHNLWSNSLRASALEPATDHSALLLNKRPNLGGVCSAYMPSSQFTTVDVERRGVCLSLKLSNWGCSECSCYYSYPASLHFTDRLDYLAVFSALWLEPRFCSVRDRWPNY